MSVESIARQMVQATDARAPEHVADLPPRAVTPTANEAPDGTSFASGSTSNTKPNLSVSVESPSWSPNGGSLGPWQPMLSELSRFPSASHKFRPPRQKDWRPEGTSKYMTPLPSPLDTRSRSLSDAASDVSTDGGGSASGSATNGRTAARSRTMQFFETMDAAFSPPPPPRMPSANYDHSKRDLYASTSSLPDSNTAPLPIDMSRPLPPLSQSPPQTARPGSSAAADTTSLAQPIALTTSTPVYQPLSNLPSAFRSDPAARQPQFAGQSAFSHTRTRSGSNGPLVLGRQTVVHDSPLPSPTESQASKWTREPPSRLPTMPPEATTAIGKPRISPHAIASTSHLASSVSSSDPSDPPPELTPAHEAEPGYVLNDRYEVVRVLGLGAFSKVVLAKRIDGPNGTPFSSAPVSAVPSPKKQQLQNLGHRKTPSSSSLSERSHVPIAPRGLAFSSVRDEVADSASQGNSSERAMRAEQPMVALKLISRSHIKKNDRMRISIVREVEVLKVGNCCAGSDLHHS